MRVVGRWLQWVVVRVTLATTEVSQDAKKGAMWMLWVVRR